MLTAAQIEAARRWLTSDDPGIQVMALVELDELTGSPLASEAALAEARTILSAQAVHLASRLAPPPGVKPDQRARVNTRPTLAGDGRAPGPVARRVPQRDARRPGRATRTASAGSPAAAPRWPLIAACAIAGVLILLLARGGWS